MSISREVIYIDRASLPPKSVCPRDSCQSHQLTRSHLPTDDPDTFEAFVYWTHFRRMPVLEPRETLTMLSQLWVFGDARAVPLLQNEAIAELVLIASKHERSFPVDIVPYIYENTRLGSPLRRVIIDLVTGGFGRKVYNFFGNWDKEALIDLGKANWKDRKERGIAGRELQTSDYYLPLSDENREGSRLASLDGQQRRRLHNPHKATAPTVRPIAYRTLSPTRLICAIFDDIGHSKVATSEKLRRSSLEMFGRSGWKARYIAEASLGEVLA
ncbi:uncharacterized protein MYCGRDRAFT_97719 [Zymoseptoria tritici IPO323]|uniref:Uncharacterized protein n=1 Tax=Zymoseptoria tritici (strain CBS 115943 / IPO323) TaxID=336722 RepID=F9XR59_ZYMTI|nr:uncharacterized protein MYCGRDRAFT_97719 [Zymoseptoria tritici IPO323]EGP82269.1 hypothetical protein MYCGRDRAFT_97719 [Zymoseptoria tritici IPO323]